MDVIYKHVPQTITELKSKKNLTKAPHKVYKLKKGDQTYHEESMPFRDPNVLSRRHGRQEKGLQEKRRRIR